MSTFDVYRSCGRVVGGRELRAAADLASGWCPWWKRGWLRFIIWNERRKRYNAAEIRLPGDSPWSGCLQLVCTVLAALFFLSVLVYAGAEIIGSMFP
jgi:hypothetical protein